MPRPRVLSVGQCGYDHSSIANHLKRSFDAEVVKADTADAAMRSLRTEGFDLVLVNRVGDRDGAPGLDLIRALKADPASAEVPVMLVSNYESAQEDAVKLGAHRGFGKADLGTGKDRAVLERVLTCGELSKNET